MPDKIKLESEESAARITETVASLKDYFATVSSRFPFTEPADWAFENKENNSSKTDRVRFFRIWIYRQ